METLVIDFGKLVCVSISKEALGYCLGISVIRLGLFALIIVREEKKRFVINPN